MMNHTDMTLAAPPPNGLATAAASHTHTVQIFDDRSVLLDETCHFLGAAMGAGDAIIVVATQDDLRDIASRLGDAGFDLERVRAQHRYVELDARAALDSFMTGDTIDRHRFSRLFGEQVERAARSSRSPDRHVTIFGEMVALLAADNQFEAAIELERCWNALAAEHPFALRCGYPMGVFCRAEDTEMLDQILSEHASVIPGESYTALPNEEERLRTITLLQQKAQVLEREIAARARADQALLKRNDELRAAVAARDEFLYVAAHELRTPVTGLRGYTQLLLRDVRRGRSISGERLAGALAVVERQIHQLNQLVSRLLDTSQIESGKLRIDLERIDLVALVRAVLERTPVPEQHALVFDGQERAEAMVDPVRFEQVIANLVDNALKYSPHGGEIRVEVDANARDGIAVSVTDHGTGIPADQLEAVFRKFHQGAPASHLTGTSGLGLGLFVSREIVQLHGGTIRIESPHHGGTRVVVTLPQLGTDSVEGTHQM